MKLNNAIVSLIFGMLGALIIVPLVRDVDAAPSDVQGSPNIAVTSYKNSQGTFILYSNGRLTDYESGRIVAPPYSDEVPDFVKARAVNGSPAGSPNVAVGIIPHKSGTYILFADGSVKNPVNANKPSGGGDIITGVILMHPSGNPHFPSTEILGTGFTIDNTIHDPSRNNVIFDEPFEETPVIVLSSMGGNNFYLRGATTPGGGTATTDGNSGVIVLRADRFGFRYKINEAPAFPEVTSNRNTPSFHFAAIPVK